jgi:hypothetical protein
MTCHYGMQLETLMIPFLWSDLIRAYPTKSILKIPTMKTNLKATVNKSILAILAIFASFTISAQSSYAFTANTLVSGTDKQQGAVYRFSSVKSGVDAIVALLPL